VSSFAFDMAPDQIIAALDLPPDQRVDDLVVLEERFVNPVACGIRSSGIAGTPIFTPRALASSSVLTFAAGPCVTSTYPVLMNALVNSILSGHVVIVAGVRQPRKMSQMPLSMDGAEGMPPKRIPVFTRRC